MKAPTLFASLSMHITNTIRSTLPPSFNLIVNRREEQLVMIDKFGALPFKGKINLKNPEKIFLVLEDWENNHSTGKLEHTIKTSFFGHQICKAPKGNH